MVLYLYLEYEYKNISFDSDVVVSSRARLARNLAEFNFKNSYTKDESKAVLEKLEEITPSLGYSSNLFV